MTCHQYRSCFLSSRQADMGIEQPMQHLGTFRKFSQIVLLKKHGERVEQAPHVPFFKAIMSGLTPLMKNGWDEMVAAHADIRGVDDEIMRDKRGQGRFHQRRRGSQNHHSKNEPGRANGMKPKAQPKKSKKGQTLFWNPCCLLHRRGREGMQDAEAAMQTAGLPAKC